MPEKATLWRTRPIFISGTFKDMHAERDHLRHVVFPALAERLRERRHHLEPVDLRLGVETIQEASEEEKEMRVLKVCLAEIERSRPFLVVLLGDRYGWVPPRERMEAAIREFGFSTDVTGKSVTALEIELGLRKEEPQQHRWCFFYFREPLPYAGMPDGLAAQYCDADSPDPEIREQHTRLLALKEEIAADPDLGSRVRRYRAGWDPAERRVTELADWGRQVLEDLWGELDAETRIFAGRPDPAREAQEREALEEFVEHRARDFIGREPITARLLAHARSRQIDGTHWGLCVTGEPGQGKSAVFAHLYRTLQQEPDLLLLAHAAGISSRATQVDGMLRRWIQELAGILQIDGPLLRDDAKPEDVERTFAALLSRASENRRAVVLIDALDQFEATARARHLAWLPYPWPANARFIATVIPGAPSEALAARPGVGFVRLAPMDAEESRQVALAIGRRYHRELHVEVLDKLFAKQLPDGSRAAGNPLWLTVAMEELNLLDEDDFVRAELDFTGTPEQRLHQMVLDVAQRLPPDVDDLYGWMLQRTEDLFGEPWARAFADVISLSRFGWRESDLRELVPRVARLLFPQRPADGWDALKFAVLRRGFRGHLVRRGGVGQWDFVHAQMRRAVRRRNLHESGLERRIHAVLADHLAALTDDDPLRQTELMVHLIGADDQRRAASYYGDPHGDATSDAALDVVEATIDGFTDALVDHVIRTDSASSQEERGIHWVTSLLDEPALSPTGVAHMCHRMTTGLQPLVEANGQLTTQLDLSQAITRMLVKILKNQEPVQGMERVQLHEDLFTGILRCATASLRAGMPDLALYYCDTAKAPLQSWLGRAPNNEVYQHQLGSSLFLEGKILAVQGAGARALDCFAASLEQCSARGLMGHGTECQETRAACLMAAGRLCLAWEDLTTARRFFEEALSLLEFVHRLFQLMDDVRAVKGWGPGLAAGAVVLHELGQPGRTLAAAERAEAILREELSVPRVQALADPVEAAAAAPGHIARRLASCYDSLGDLALQEDRLPAAIELFESSLAIRQRLSERGIKDLHGIAESWNRIGAMRWRSRDLDGAIDAYRSAQWTLDEKGDFLDACLMLDVANAHLGVAQVLAYEADYADGVRECDLARRFLKILVDRDASNAVALQSMARCERSMETCLAALGEPTKANEHHQRAIAMLEDLVARDGRRVDWQKELTLSRSEAGEG